VPAGFVAKWQAYLQNSSQGSLATLAVGVGSLAIMLVLRYFVPRLPGMIVAVMAASCVVYLFHIQVDTIGTRFGGIPRALPTPQLPSLDLDLARKLIPSAMTIAILVAIESLRSAAVADGMTGDRHKADCELISQGIANISSSLFGGLPATGAIARTAANVKSGGKTPIAGMVHALTLLVIMLTAAPLASQIPLATLATVLIVAAWNMAEIDDFRSILRAARSDVMVLLATFGLTVLTDLPVAVGVGVVLASCLFIKRMAVVSNVGAIAQEFNEDDE
jgi:SulP family sulfate permease